MDEVCNKHGPVYYRLPNSHEKCNIGWPGFAMGFANPEYCTAVPGDASKTRVIWYTHPRRKPVFTDGLRVPAGYTESVLVTFPQW